MKLLTTMAVLTVLAATVSAGVRESDPAKIQKLSPQEATQLKLKLHREELSKGRIKDITTLKGVRDNALSGYGLVVGLRGTGDGSPVSARAMASMLRKGNKIAISPKDTKSKAIASVYVTAKLGPFKNADDTIDVEVAIIGDASSLQGGTLLMTPLKGADGEVYAVATGPISIGGFSAEGEAASVTKGHPTVARIPSGARVERSEKSTYLCNGTITLQLRNPDFTTADRIATEINKKYPDIAKIDDPGSIRVRVPQSHTSRVPAFMASIHALRVKTELPAIIVVNERTGTIIVSDSVRISPVAISQGSLTMVVKESTQVSQPGPLAKAGSTVQAPDTQISVKEKQSAFHIIPEQVSLKELADALNAMGLTPTDLIAIFESLKRAGALEAELKIM